MSTYRLGCLVRRFSEFLLNPLESILEFRPVRFLIVFLKQLANFSIVAPFNCCERALCWSQCRSPNVKVAVKAVKAVKAAKAGRRWRRWRRFRIPLVVWYGARNCQVQLRGWMKKAIKGSKGQRKRWSEAVKWSSEVKRWSDGNIQQKRQEDGRESLFRVLCERHLHWVDVHSHVEPIIIGHLCLFDHFSFFDIFLSWRHATGYIQYSNGGGGVFFWNTFGGV